MFFFTRKSIRRKPDAFYLTRDHLPQSLEEMAVGHFQHTGDPPLLRPETVELLAARWEKDPEKILRPFCQDTPETLDILRQRR